MAPEDCLVGVAQAEIRKNTARTENP